MIVETGGKVIPIEVKASMTYGANLVRNLQLYCDSDTSAVSPLLIYDGVAMKDIGSHGVEARNWRKGWL